MARVSFGKAISAIASGAIAIICFGIALLFRAVKWLILPVAWLMAIAVIILSVLLFVVPTTSRDIAYRNIDPDSKLCDFDPAKAWDVLADDLIDNDELKALAKFPKKDWERKFSCSLQRHVIPSASGEKPLSFNLAFVEFREDGSPYELIKDDGKPYSLDELSSRVKVRRRKEMGADHAAPRFDEAVAAQQ